MTPPHPHAGLHTRRGVLRLGVQATVVVAGAALVGTSCFARSDRSSPAPHEDGVVNELRALEQAAIDLCDEVLGWDVAANSVLRQALLALREDHRAHLRHLDGILGGGPSAGGARDTRVPSLGSGAGEAGPQQRTAETLVTRVVDAEAVLTATQLDRALRLPPGEQRALILSIAAIDAGHGPMMRVAVGDLEPVDTDSFDAAIALQR